MSTTITNTIPSLAEVEAAKRAANTNAESWVEGFGRPYDGDAADESIARILAGEPLDDIHIDVIAEELGYGEDNGRALANDQILRLWPVYRAALVSKVNELLAQEKG